MRAVRAVAVLWLFPVLLVGLLIGLGWVLWTYRDVGGFVFAAKFVLVPIVVAVLWSVVEVIKAPPPTLDGVEITTGEHPRLWAELRDIAGRMDAAVPDRVVLIPEANACVLESRKGRELGIGLPFLVAYSVPELRAVIAHEFGHLTGGDTAMLARAQRGHLLLERVRANASPFTGWVFAAYAAVVDLAWASASRAQEARADEAALRAADPGAAASAMRTSLRAGMAWDVLVDRGLEWFLASGFRAPLGEGLRELMDGDRDRLEAAVEECLADETASVFDTHPPVRERIARYTEAATGTDTRHTSSATRGVDLLSDGWAWLARHEGTLFDLELPLRDWDDVARLGGAAEATRLAGRLADALELSDTLPEATYAAMLDHFGAKQWSDLPALLDLDPDDDEQIAQMVAKTIEAALVESDVARHVLDAQQSAVLVDLSGTEIDVAALTRQSRADAAGVAAQLRDHGVELQRRPGSVLQLATPELLGVITLATGPWSGARDVLVLSNGLAAVPHERGALRRALRDDPSERLGELARRAGELSADPEVFWIPLEQIAAARIFGIEEDKFDLRLRDGSLVCIRPGGDSAALQEPGFELRRLLRDRARPEAWGALPVAALSGGERARLVWRQGWAKAAAVAVAAGVLFGFFAVADHDLASTLKSRDGLVSARLEVLSAPTEDGDEVAAEVRFLSPAPAELSTRETYLLSPQTFRDPDNITAGSVHTFWVAPEDPEYYAVEEGAANYALAERQLDATIAVGSLALAAVFLVIAWRRSRRSYAPAPARPSARPAKA